MKDHLAIVYEDLTQEVRAKSDIEKLVLSKDTITITFKNEGSAN